jgi:hypothetical protein
LKLTIQPFSNGQDVQRVASNCARAAAELNDALVAIGSAHTTARDDEETFASKLHAVRASLELALHEALKAAAVSAELQRMFFIEMGGR